jgi:hypothetical protein
VLKSGHTKAVVTAQSAQYRARRLRHHEGPEDFLSVCPLRYIAPPGIGLLYLCFLPRLEPVANGGLFLRIGGQGKG